LKKLDISNNPQITIKGYRIMMKFMLERKIKLTHLSLDGNEIGDQVCQELCGFLSKMGAIQMLNLSKCAITDYGAQYLANLLENRSLRLRGMALHWNQIRGKGACLLANALKFNSFLLVFDASFNSFGSCPLMKKAAIKEP
jgi:Ran GTPase-activating protein (RanGAP) involved in mRNA processing and transport